VGKNCLFVNVVGIVLHLQTLLETLFRLQQHRQNNVTDLVLKIVVIFYHHIILPQEKKICCSKRMHDREFPYTQQTAASFAQVPMFVQQTHDRLYSGVMTQGKVNTCAAASLLAARALPRHLQPHKHVTQRAKVTATARVWSHVRSPWLCGDRIGTEAGFLRVLRFPLPILIPPTAPYQFNCYCIIPILAVRTAGFLDFIHRPEF
jgi:hypothetical protein